jgi:ribosomal protein S12 methylthiotransferase
LSHATETYREPRAAETAKGRYAFVSLGCPKNLVDSERMLGLLKLDGYELVADPEGTDFVVVNTCGFIEQARQESFSTIDEMIRLKRAGKTKGVIVTGCLAERQREDMLKERPEIDSLVGVFGREKITAIADRLVGNLHEQRHVFQPAPIRALSDHNRLQITPQHFAYLKISEGCDRLCTFCAIPKMRGKHASKPMETILEEAHQLAANGVRELIIVAQDTTYYGKDIYGQPRLAELLRKLDQIIGIDWIRLMYFYPMYIDQELIETIGSAKHILPYVDIPLQHINNTMLRRMSRRVNREQTDQIIADLRGGIPNLAIRTTFITGFPGETQEQVDELGEFIGQQKFEHVGVFTYSFEPDTPAAKLEGQIAEEIKQQRRDQLMEIQQANVFERTEAMLGQQIDVIIDKQVTDEAGVLQTGQWIGRSKFDAPDVDGLVFVTDPELNLSAGRIVRCEIVASQGYDLIGVSVEEPR